MIIDEGKVPRLAVAGWGHDWLTGRQGDRHDQHNLAETLDGLLERGFNAVRLDPCPHLIAAPVTGIHLDRFELLPETTARGQEIARPALVRPRRALLEVLAAMQQRNLRVWLSSAFLPDSQARRSFIRRPRDFVRVWSETLEFIRQEGLGDTIAGVDFGREFPAPPAGWGAYRRIFHRHPRNPLPLAASWSHAMVRRADHYLLDVPRALRAGFPDYLYGLSTTSPLIPHLRQLDTSELDFLDYHLWLNDDRQFQLASGELVGRFAGPLAARMQGRVAGLAWRARRAGWHERVDERLEEFLEFCRVRRLEPALTDGFVDFPRGGADRTLARELGDRVITRAVAGGVRVVSPGCQVRPGTGPLWSDLQWIERQTRRILTGPGR